MFERQIGIDLGTVNVQVYVTGRGIVMQEPSVVAISIRDNKIVSVGQEAREMLGRSPESIEVARPMRDGVIADYVVTEAMLRYFIHKVIGRGSIIPPAGDDQHSQRRDQRGEPCRARRGHRGTRQGSLLDSGTPGGCLRRGVAHRDASGQHGNRHRRRHDRGRGDLDE